jgi:hypothetical protein
VKTEAVAESAGDPSGERAIRGVVVKAMVADLSISAEI